MDPAFIFAVGDDACDEPIFNYLGEYLKKRNYGDFENFHEEKAGNQHCITCLVGRNKTHASYYIPNVSCLQEALEELTKPLY